MTTARGRIRRRQLATIVVVACVITPVFNVLTSERPSPRRSRSSLDLVVSGALLQRLALPPGVQATRCGELELRGKEARVAASGLTRAPI